MIRSVLVLLCVAVSLGAALVAAPDATAFAGGLPTPLSPPREATPWQPDLAPDQHGRLEAEMKARLGARLLAVAADAEKAAASMTAYDARFYDLVLDLDPAATTLTGTTTMRADVTAGPLTTLDLHLDLGMLVSAVRVGGAATTWSRFSQVLTVTLDRTYATGETVEVAVDYAGNPASSYFGWDQFGGQPLVWTLSEPYGARRWWACKDLNTDKADSVALHVTAPENLTVVSNGSLDATTVPGPGLRTWHWTERYPIAPYLVSLAAHPYVLLEDEFVAAGGDTMPVRHWVLPGYEAQAAAGYAATPAMLGVFGALYGEYPYITEKYGHAHFPWGGGMEHQTCSSMTYSYYGQTFVAHELAHQWMGDLVTCADFRHIWINEGFATWSEAYWREQTEGTFAYKAEMADARYLGAGTIIVEDPTNSTAIFNFSLTYQKASWVPHMLRHVVGEEDFRAGLALLRERHGFASATTEDVQAVFEDASRQDLAAFFQQWIYGQYFPVYQVTWRADPVAAGTRVSFRIAQTQGNTGPFTMPIDVRLGTSLGDTTFVVPNSEAAQWYAVEVPGDVYGLEIDPDDWILCEKTVGGISDVPDGTAAPAVSLATLRGNAPNPFNPATTIRFALPAAGAVTVDIHDAAGRRVRRLVAGDLAAGEHAVVWRGDDQAGRAVASGTYFVRLAGAGAGAADVLPITLVR